MEGRIDRIDLLTGFFQEDILYRRGKRKNIYFSQFLNSSCPPCIFLSSSYDIKKPAEPELIHVHESERLVFLQYRYIYSIVPFLLFFTSPQGMAIIIRCFYLFFIQYRQI